MNAAMKAAITILNQGYDYAREIALLKQLDIEAVYLPLEGTDDTEEIINTLRGFNFVLAGPELWSGIVFQSLKDSLKMVARLGAGVDKMDIPAASACGIAVSNTPGANACSVAQHVLGFMLDLSRSMTAYDRSMRINSPASRKMVDDLIGKTVGLVGFGNISKEVAKLLSGFNCDILAYDVYKDEKAAASLGVRFAELDELLAKSDYVSLHVPLLPETKGMVDLKFLRSMKPTAYLINTSRGPVVNEKDLIFALENGIIAGAGLDVFENQPLDPDSKLLKLENTVLTPYVAFSSKLGNRRTMDMAIQSIREYIEGKPISHLLNPDYVKNLS